MAAILPRPVAELAQLVATLFRAFDLIENFEPWRKIGVGDNPAFQNGWGNDSASEDAAFRKNILGQVEVRGSLSNAGGGATGNGTVVFTLPRGYRPLKQERRFVVAGFTGLAAPVVGLVVVASTGTCTLTLSGVALNAGVSQVNFEFIFHP